MLSLIVRAIIPETADTLTIVFEPAYIPFSYEAGQYITLLVPIKGETHTRSYSLASSPYTEKYPSITVKRVEGGVVSNYLNDHITPGQEVTLLPPQGNFTLVPQREMARELVFIAGGSGITPLYAMIKTVLTQEPKSRVYLIDANRTEGDIIYRKSLEALERDSDGRFEITHVLSKGSATWQGMRGRLRGETLESLLERRELGVEASYFICAPESLIAMSVETLLAMGVDRGQIHTESYVAAKVEGEGKGVDAKVVICCDGEEEEVEVPKGEYILEAAYEQGIYTIPSSCRNGICDTCRAKCIEGKVHMEHDEGLTEEEKAEGYVLTCVAQCLTEEVKLEVE